MRAYMRVLGLDEQDLEVLVDKPIEGLRTVVVSVPGFGYLSVALTPAGVIAALFQPPSTAPNARTPLIVDGRVEVPMLHKADRLDVVIEGLVDA